MKVFLDVLGQLNPLFQFVTLLVVIFYTCTTWSMAKASEKGIREMRLSREEQAKPKVVCYFEHNKTSTRSYDFVIKNYGHSAAFNVRLDFSPPLKRYRPSKFDPVKEKTFKIMAPGYEWRTFWDSFPGAVESLMPDEFTANVSYDWDNPQKHETCEVRFDIKSLMGKMWLGETTIGDSLQEIAENVKNIVNEDSIKEIAASIKIVEKTLEKQAKTKRYRNT